MSAIDDIAMAHASVVIKLRQQLRNRAERTVAILGQRQVKTNQTTVVLHEVGEPCETWPLSTENEATVQYKICLHGHIYRTQRFKQGGWDKFRKVELDRLSLEECERLDSYLRATIK